VVNKKKNVPEGPNQVWSMDFKHDSFWDGKPFRVLNIVDDLNRQALRIEPDTSLKADRVVRVLNQLKDTRGVPAMIRVDNGPELVSIKLDLWCRENGVTLAFIQPGKPTQNAFIERFNRTLRPKFSTPMCSGPSLKCVSTWICSYSTTTTIGPTRGLAIEHPFNTKPSTIHPVYN